MLIFKRVLFGIALLIGANTVQAACTDLYNHQFTTLQGKSVNLCDYQDKPILVVNTASKCGFTPQFEKLEALYKKYKDKGLLVIGFPSNDFRQELTSNKEIGDFCKMTYAVEFPMIAKSSVVGPNANPLYKELAALTKEPPMWNFYKYLILPGATSGTPQVFTYSSDVAPDSSDILDKLKPYIK
ncbi:MAG: glutathione peroxidase [Methylophilaceae bacterium]|nr:glutathione peroxidase [Methyloradius sp.]